MSVFELLGYFAMWFFGTVIVSYVAAIACVLTVGRGMELAGVLPGLYAFIIVWVASIAGALFWLGGTFS